MTLINVLAGTDYTEDAVALDNFRNFSVYNAPGDLDPNLNDVNPPVSITIASSISGNFTIGGGTFSGAAIISGFYNTSAGEKPIDAISALFMHDHVYNDYVLDSQTASGTDWVLTFPTKRFYYDASGDVLNLFQSNLGTDGACDNISLTVYDREEQHASGSAGFSPPKPGKSNQLCWESTVLTFNASQVLGSTNNRNLTVSYQNGWGRPAVPVHHGFVDTQPVCRGFVRDRSARLPDRSERGLLGPAGHRFAVQSYFNGNLPESNGTLVQSSYGGNFVHKTTRAIDVEAFLETGLSKSHAKKSKGKKSK